MSAPDASEIYEIEKRLKSACKKLHDMASEVGMAKQIIEYDSDRRKNLLARYAVKNLKAGDSATASETSARADAAYEAELAGLADTFSQAQATIKAYDAEMCSWESARSLLAMRRAIQHSLPGTED